MTDSSMTTDENVDPAAFIAELEQKLYGNGDAPAVADETPAPVEPPVVEPVAEVVEPPVVEPPVAEPVAQEPVAPVAPVVAPEPEDEDEVPTATPQPQIRFRPTDERTAEVARMMKAGLKYDEIQEVLAKRDGRATEPEANEGPDIGAMEARLAEIDRVIDEAGQAESIMTPEIAKAIRERGDLVADVKLAKRDVETRTQARLQDAQRAFQSEYQSSQDLVLELYPDANNPDSELSRAIDADVHQILNTPNHPLVGNSEAPMILAAKHARALKIAPATGQRPSGEQPAAPAVAPNPQQQTPRPTPTEATPPRPGLTPATGAARTAPQPPIPSAAQQQADLQRSIAEAKTDDEAKAILATVLYGSATAASPFA
jgi:hypothetical protein